MLTKLSEVHTASIIRAMKKLGMRNIRDIRAGQMDRA
jgi:DNA-binding MurR/RpiR family transcriptional regulator